MQCHWLSMMHPAQSVHVRVQGCFGASPDVMRRMRLASTRRMGVQATGWKHCASAGVRRGITWLHPCRHRSFRNTWARTRARCAVGLRSLTR